MVEQLKGILSFSVLLFAVHMLVVDLSCCSMQVWSWGTPMVWLRCASSLATKFWGSWNPRVWLLTCPRICTTWSRRLSLWGSTWRGAERYFYFVLSSPLDDRHAHLIFTFVCIALFTETKLPNVVILWVALIRLCPCGVWELSTFCAMMYSPVPRRCKVRRSLAFRLVWT